MNPLDAWTFDSGLYLANVAAAATLACASALAAARVLKSRPAPVRYGVLLAAMLLALLSPGVAWTARALGLSPLCISATVPEKIAEAVAPMVEPAALLPTPEAPTTPAPWEPVSPPPAEPAIEAAAPTEPLPWPQILLAAAALVWSAGTAVCLVFLVRGLVLVQRLRKSLRPARDARLDAAATRAASVLGLLKPPRVCVSDLIPAPLSLGLARPVIVMPEGLAETLSERDLEAVVLHEAAHIAHRDHWVGLLQRVVLALFWWNPLVRMLSDRLSAAREEVCDNYVVRAQGDGRPFAQFLVRMAGRLTACRRLTAAIGLVQEPRRGLEERIRGLLRKERNTMTRMNLAAMALVGAFALGLGGLMLLSTVGTAEEADDTEAAPAEEVSKATPVWVAILPESPIPSLRGYHHALKVVNPAPEPPLYKPAPIPACDLEIRPEMILERLVVIPNGTRIVRVPYAGYFRENGEPDEPARRRMGDLPDGEYLVALCVGDKRISNVARLRIASAFDARKAPALELIPLSPAPGCDLRYVGLVGTGRDPMDPEFKNDTVAFPTLVVDGIERHLTSSLWVGPVAPLQPGQREFRIIHFGGYKPPIAPAAEHKVTARVLTYESAPVVISLRDALGEQWDAMTGRLPAVAPPTDVLSGTEAAPEDAGEAVGGLRLSLTVPCEKEYGGRMTLPLLLVLKNDGDARAAPADLRWGPPAIEAVDAGGRPVRVRDLIDITPWEGRLAAGAIPPGAAVPWMLWFDRFSFLDPLRPDTTLRVRVRLGGAGGLASNWVTLGIKSSGPPLLGPGNVPGTWQGFMDLVYREANNLRGYRAIHVDGDGRVTVVAVTGGKDPLLGRHEIVLAKADLDALADLLNRQWAWALHAVKQETASPDEPTVALSLSSAGNLMAGEWPMRTVRQTPALLAIQQAMVRLMEKTVAAAQAAQHGWGPLSDDGVQARLRADSASWKAAETPTFRADVRNLGMRELFVAAAQQLCELEVDAKWHRWVGEISVISGAFGPGGEYGDVPVVLDDKWHSKEGAKPLHLEAGRHTIRIAFIASPQDRNAGPPVRAESNAVEIEILPAEAMPAAPTPQAGERKAAVLEGPWVWMAPEEKTVKSLKDLRVIAVHRDVPPEGYTDGWCEIRKADSNEQVARFAHNWIQGQLSKANEVNTGVWLRGNRPEVGDLPNGEYLLAWYIGNRRYSSTTRFKIDSNYDSSKEPLLSLEEIPPAPGKAVPLLVIRNYRHAESDPAPSMMHLFMPTLNVDGQDHLPGGAAGSTPGPTRVGGHQATILVPSLYRPPIDFGKKHVVFAKVGELRSQPITIGAEAPKPAEAMPAAPPAEEAPRATPVWVALLPRSPIPSLREYHHALKVVDPAPEPPLYRPAPIPACDFEIRRAKDQARVARIPYLDYFRKNGEPNESDRRRIGDLRDGDYLVALCVGAKRISNVARLRIASAFDARKAPALEIVPLPPAPGRDLGHIGLVATGRDAVDPEFKNDTVAFPTLVVDGIERRLTGITWVGPVAPLQPGQREFRIIDFAPYKPPIAPAAEHKVAARVLAYESATVVISSRDDLGERWDAMTGRLPSVAPPRAVLRGTVTGPDGKPAAGYEVGLSNPSGGRFSEQTGDDGAYEFVNIPAGEYQLWANPPGKGQPIVNLKSTRIEADKTLRRDLGLEQRFSISGRVTYADGAPAPGREVMTTWRSADGSAEFDDFAAAGPDGRYTVSAPFETATYVGLSGTGPQPQPHHNVQAGRSDVDFVLPAAPRPNSDPAAMPPTESRTSVAELLARFKAERDRATKEHLLYGLTEGPDLSAADRTASGRGLLELARTATDIDTRFLAIRGLGVLRYVEAKELCVESLRDAHPWIRANAARALGEMAAVSAAGQLAALLERETDGGVIEQTSLALQHLGAKEAVPALRRHADHKNAQTRAWVLQAIGDLGGREDVAFLAAHLADADVSVQEAAAKAIEKIAGKNFGFPEAAGPTNPEPAIERAREWWKANKEAWGAAAAPLAWGEAVEGVQVRLRAEEMQWKAGEMPLFKVDLRSEKERPMPIGPAGPDRELEVTVDDQAYQYSGPDIRSVVDPSPVAQRKDIHLALSRGWKSTQDGTPLALTPGKHKVRVAFTVHPSKEAGGKPVRAESNAVEIEILPADAKPATQSEAEATNSANPPTVRTYEYDPTLIRELGKIYDMRGQPNDFELIHKRAAELAEQFSKPEEIAKICLQVLLCHACSGNRGAEDALGYAQRASALPMQAVDRSRLFGLWADVLDHTRRGAKGADLARFRKESTILRLRAMQIAEAYQVPEELPPKSGRAIAFFTPPEEREAIEKEKREYEFSENLHLYRSYVRQHIIYYYSLKPLATEELADLARSILGEGPASQSLLEAVKEGIQAKGTTSDGTSTSPSTPPAARLAVDAAEIDRLIGQLGSEKSAEREDAQKVLVKIGLPAVAALQKAASDKDAERSQRAQTALNEIDDKAFGGQADGFQIRLRPLLSRWKTGQTVSLQLQLCNRGQEEIGCPGFRTPEADCHIELDGQWYWWSLPVSINVLDLLLKPGQVEVLGVDLVESWVAMEEGKSPSDCHKKLILAPGAHVVRVSYGDTISNPVHLEFQADPATPPAAPTSGPGLDDATKADTLSPQEQKLVGVWRFSKTVYSDDNQEGTELMVLNPDRTWSEACYLGKDEIPKMFWKINCGPRWICYQGRLQQYFPPPKGGGEHLYDRKILSVSPTTLAFEYMRKPELGPLTYNRVSRQTEVAVRNLLETTSPPRRGGKGEEPPWGEAVEGVGVRLRADKAQWKAGETPTLTADVRNQGAREHLAVVDNYTFLQLQVDGQWYRPENAGGVQKPLPSNTLSQADVPLSPSWYRIGPDQLGPRPQGFVIETPKQFLELPAGNHVIRVGAVLHETRANTGGSVWAISNAVEIEILPAETKEAAAIPPAPQGASAPAGEDKATSLRERQKELRLEVEKETLAETVHNLMHKVHTLEGDFPRSPQVWYPPQMEEYLRQISSDPRVAKLLTIAREGTDADRQMLREAILRELRAYTNDLPDWGEEGKPWRPSVMDPGGGFAYGFLLIHCDPDAGSLPVLVTVYLRQQEAVRKYFKRNESSAWSGSEHGMVVAYACAHLLDQHLSRTDLRREATSEQRRVLKAYEAYRNSQDTKKWTPFGAEFEVMRFASDFVQAAAPIPPAPEGASRQPGAAGDKSVRAVGGYDSPRVDKAKWGEFELVLELPKARFDPNEAIQVRLLMRNTGRTTIRLDGIRPMRSSANPPSLDVEGPESRLIRLHGVGIPPDVDNDKPIVIEPDKTLVLIDADLRTLPGSVQDGEAEPHVQKVLGPFLGDGEYTIRGRFMPTPQVYSCSTPRVRFRIGAIPPAVREASPPAPEGATAPPATLQVGEGRVRLQSGDTAVEAKRLTIEDGRLEATGDVVLQSGNDRLRADKLEARTAAPPPAKIVSDIPVLRDGDQGINTLDLSATVRLGEVPLGLRALYASPDRRALWVVDPASGVPLLVLAEGKALLYDVVNRSVTVMATRQIPSFRLRQIGEDFKMDFSSIDTAKDREPAILLDVASVLNLEGNTLTFGMQPDGERWVEAVSARGNTARAALDASTAYPVRRFEIIAKGQQAPGLRVDIQVNQPVPASLLSMPDLEVLASRMELKRLDTPRSNNIGEAMASVQDFLKTAQGSLVARFAMDSAEHRRELEKSLGRSIDWDAVRKFDAQAIEAFRQAGALLPPAPPPTKQLPATGPEADRAEEELKALRQSLARPAEYGLPKKSLPPVERLVEIGSAEAVRVLYEALTDPRVSRKVKLHALPALGRIGTDEALNAYRDYQRWANEFPRDRPFEFGPHENPMDHFADQDLAPLVKWSAGSGQTQREFAAFRWGRYGETRLWLVSRAPSGPWDTPGLLAMSAGDAERIGKAEHLTGVYDAGRLALKGDDINLTVDPRREADDADKDGVPDAVEVMLGTDPKKADSDGDGTPDGNDSNPLTPKPAQVSEDMEIRQAAFLALFGTSSTHNAANIVWAPGWDAGAKEPAEIPEWARQEYYGMGGYVLRSQRIRQGWVNITSIDIKRKSATEALVTISDYEGNSAASVHEIVVKKMGKLWVPVSVQMTIIS